MRAEHRSTRARLAATMRHHPDDTEAIAEYRSQFKAGRAEAYIRQLVDSAPPLSPEVRDKLAVLLRGPDAA